MYGFSALAGVVGVYGLISESKQDGALEPAGGLARHGGIGWWKRRR